MVSGPSQARTTLLDGGVQTKEEVQGIRQDPLWGVPELLSSRELRVWDRITDGMRTGEIVGATKKDAWETLFF
jgi:hypothetical protein